MQICGVVLARAIACRLRGVAVVMLRATLTRLTRCFDIVCVCVCVSVCLCVCVSVFLCFCVYVSVLCLCLCARAISVHLLCVSTFLASGFEILLGVSVCARG